MKNISYWTIMLLALIWEICRSIYFGVTPFPKSDMAMLCWGITFIIMALAFTTKEYK